MNNKFIILPLICLSLAACQTVPKPKIDAAKLLEELKGPEIKGVDATVIESAEAASKRGEHAKEAQLYKQLLDRKPDDARYQYGYAESLRKGGDIDNSMAIYRKMLEKNPKSADALEGLGLALLAKGKFDEAAAQLTEVMAIDAARWRTVNALGVILTANNRGDEAIEYFREALTISKDNPTILNNIGLALAMKRDFEGAIKALSQASESLTKDDAGKRRTDLNLAMVYGIAGKVDEAEKICRQYLPDVAVYNNLGFYSVLAGNPEMAKSYLNMAVTGSPKYYEKAWENLESAGKKKNQSPVTGH